MKIHIETVENLAEDEVLIRCAKVDSTIQKIHQYILEQASAAPKIVFYRDNQEFYLSLSDILFFETDTEQVYAHTKDSAYRTKYRLYELESTLPPTFVRASKSSIINTAHIYSITRNITSSSLVQFRDTHKQMYVSRHYYKALHQRLSERSTSI